MNEEQFENEKMYSASIALAKSWLNKGLLKEAEIKLMDELLKEKYKPMIGRLV